MLNKTKNAFTLAEVLITLVIIGIVAALTIPSAINHYKERVTIEKIKSSYAILSTAYRLAQMENGSKYSEWNCDSFQDWSNGSKHSNCMTYYIKKHLKRVKDCNLGSGSDSNPNAVCMGNEGYEFYSISGLSFGEFTSGSGDNFILSNGVPVSIRRNYHIYIKTDNSKKLVYNKNFFNFWVEDNEKGLLPYSNSGCWSSMDQEAIRTGLINGCHISAVKWIFTKDNMDYLH